MAKGKLTLDDDRIRRDDDDERGDRADNDKFDSQLASDSYENMLEAEFNQSSLPDPPELDGYKMMWLSTTHKIDTISRRQRIGYELVAASELPGFLINEKLGGYENYVTCAEMVLAKIHKDKYQAIMSLMHHKKPLQQETGAVDMFAEVGNNRRIGGADDGISQMEKEMKMRWKAPTFD